MAADTCGDCGAVMLDRYEHGCKLSDLPAPLVEMRGWSIRETPLNGRSLWKHYVEKGKGRRAYCVGAVAGADKDALLVAVDAAEEEMAYLVGEARREFG